MINEIPMAYKDIDSGLERFGGDGAYVAEGSTAVTLYSQQIAFLNRILAVLEPNNLDGSTFLNVDAT